MTRLSIRWRLTLWYAAALAVILCAFCLILLVLTRHQLLARTDAALREELQELALEARLANGPDDFAKQVKSRFYQHDIYDFLVSDSSGRMLFISSGLTSSSAIGLPKASADVTLHFQNHLLDGKKPFRVATTATDGSLGRLTVQAVTSLAPFYAEMQTLQLLMLTLLPLGIAGALVVGYFLADRALAPVKHIVDDTNAITISNLDRRIEVVNPHDEIGCLATTLNSLIARLEGAVSEIRRFTADASHELRTPLAALRHEAESALRSPRSSEEYEQTLAIVVEEATRLGRLTDQLLNLSRDDAGIMTRPFECVRLDALIQDVADQLRPLAVERGVSLHCEGIAPCEIQGDDVRLSQAFFNVLQNAVKFTPEGGCVTVRGDVSEKSGVFEVQDTGIGISAEHLPRVFDRFYQVDPARGNENGGSGLGLSIARAAVVAHCGQIKIVSLPGMGTTVTIRFSEVQTIDAAETPKCQAQMNA